MIDATGQIVSVDVEVASGPTLLVTAIAGRKIRVLALYLVADAAADVGLVSALAGTPITRSMSLAANQPLVWPLSPLGWCQTRVGESLVLASSIGVQIGGVLVFQEIK